MLRMIAIGLVGLGAVGVSSSLAATYVVNPDGTGDLPTIQAAINAALGGDIIELTDPAEWEGLIEYLPYK